MYTKSLIYIWIVCVILMFIACAMPNVFEFKKYESNWKISPFVYLYYKSIYHNVHFPLNTIEFNRDSTFCFETCSTQFDGKFVLKGDTIKLYPYTKQLNIFPNYLINKRHKLISIKKIPGYTLVWTVKK